MHHIISLWMQKFFSHSYLTEPSGSKYPFWEDASSLCSTTAYTVPSVNRIFIQPFFYFTKLMDLWSWQFSPCLSLGNVILIFLSLKHSILPESTVWGTARTNMVLSMTVRTVAQPFTKTGCPSTLSWHLRGLHHDFLSHKDSDHLIFKAIWEMPPSAEENDW